VLFATDDLGSNVLDTKGTIRYKNVRDHAMDKAVDSLLDEIAQRAKATH
jgi:hypothetical protein